MENTEQKAGPDKYVEYAYKLYNEENNELLFEATREHPDAMLFGMSPDIVPALEAAMDGLKAGDKFETVLPPDAAFGHRSEEMIMELDKEIFMRDGKLADEVTVGALLPMMTADGHRVPGKVLEIGDKIKMDFNHPFAGLTVRYDGEVILVRDATEDELNPQSGCGGGCCGGCGSHEGDCGGGCGDSNGSCGCSE